jgi:hypothetical protein
VRATPDVIRRAPESSLEDRPRDLVVVQAELLTGPEFTTTVERMRGRSARRNSDPTPCRQMHS